jgi:hypothetical protein
VNFVVRDVYKVLGGRGSRTWPVAVRMGVVALPSDSVDPDHVAYLHSVEVIDKTSPDVAVKQIRGPSLEVDVGVIAMAGPDVIDALKKPRDPSDAAL